MIVPCVGCLNFLGRFAAQEWKGGMTRSEVSVLSSLYSCLKWIRQRVILLFYGPLCGMFWLSASLAFCLAFPQWPAVFAFHVKYSARSGKGAGVYLPLEGALEIKLLPGTWNKPVLISPDALDTDGSSGRSRTEICGMSGLSTGMKSRWIGVILDVDEAERTSYHMQGGIAGAAEHP